jgi:hypothetical protein
MKRLMRILRFWNFDFSYPIAEGVEEYRVKREILSNMKQDGSRTAFGSIDECGSLRLNRKNSNDP